MTQPVIDYYAVLQVERDASPDGVRRAWRRLATKHHPDKAQGNANAQSEMAAINVAYAVLSDPHERALHDRCIEAGHGKPAPARASWFRR